MTDAPPRPTAPVLVLAASAAKRCLYCIVAHGARVRGCASAPATVTVEQQDQSRGRGLTGDDLGDVGAIVALFARVPRA